MAGKAQIRIVGRTEDAGTTQMQAECDLYVKSDAIYCRYAEQDPEMGSTNTTMKVTAEELTIIRHGDVESKQIFRLHRRHPGFYRTANVQLLLETDTSALAIQLEEGLGTIEWTYELLIDGQSSGSRMLAVQIETIPAAEEE